MTARFLIRALFATVVGALGCGDPGDDRPASSLTDEEKGQICDDIAARWGGYGKVIECGGGLTVEAPDSRADCVARTFPTCDVSVGKMKACALAIARSQCGIFQGLPSECQGVPASCFRTG